MRPLSRKAFELPDDVGAVVVGVSGGADSVALLHMLCFGEEELELAVCHINHNLRGAESIRDRDFVVSLCQQWDIPVYVKELDIRSLARGKRLSVEECGRQERYRFFAETAGQLSREKGKSVVVATAHTASDNAETVLFNLVRGTGLKGLCGIPKARGDVIRPLRSVTREEVEAYLEENGLSYVHDSTNDDTVYTRNRIRHEVVPVLKEINPAWERSVERTSLILSAEDDFLAQQSKRAYREAALEDGLSCEVLMSLHTAIRWRVLMQLLHENALPVSWNSVRAAETAMFENKKISVGKDVYLSCSCGILKIVRTKPPVSFSEKSLEDGEMRSLTGVLYKVQTFETLPSALFHKVYKNMFDISFDCGKISGSVIIRQRRDGDKIKLHYHRHTKSLKKLFQEAGISVGERTRRFVLSDDMGVIAVEGFGVAERVKCDCETKQIKQILPVKGTLEG